MGHGPVGSWSEMATALGRHYKSRSEERECKDRCYQRALVEGGVGPSFLSFSLFLPLSRSRIYLPLHRSCHRETRPRWYPTSVRG